MIETWIRFNGIKLIFITPFALVRGKSCRKGLILWPIVTYRDVKVKQGVGQVNCQMFLVFSSCNTLEFLVSLMYRQLYSYLCRKRQSWACLPYLNTDDENSKFSWLDFLFSLLPSFGLCNYRYFSLRLPYQKQQQSAYSFSQCPKHKTDYNLSTQLQSLPSSL